MPARVLHYSDIENAYDDPERIGRLVGTLASLRDETAIVVGTGDDIAPSVLSLATEGRQSLEFFRAVSTDVETFGNHDFDFSLDAAREIVAASPQTWLAANVYDGDERFADVPASTVVERAGVRVGFVGVADPEISIPDALAVTDPVDAVRDAVVDLRDRGVDRAVALAHVGDAVARDIAAATDVDAVLAGHVHDVRRERVDGTLLVRPGANGRDVWEVVLGDEVIATHHDVPEGPLDEDVAAHLETRMAETGLTETVARVDDPVRRERERCFEGECRVANFVTDAYRWAAGTDVGFVDTRGIRTGPPLAGEVTVADLIGLSPFAGDLFAVSLSGRELRALVEGAVRTGDAERGRIRDGYEGDIWWGHFGGMRVEWNADDGAAERISIGGDLLDPARKYTLATNGFVVGSDVEFTAVTRSHVVDTWGAQYDALVEFAREFGVEPELDGRITIVSGSDGR